MKKRTCSLILAFCLCLGLLPAGRPAEAAEELPELSYEEARDRWGFTVEFRGADLGRVTEEAAPSPARCTITNNADRKISVFPHYTKNLSGYSDPYGDGWIYLEPGESCSYDIRLASHLGLTPGENRFPIRFTCGGYQKNGIPKFNVTAGWVTCQWYDQDSHAEDDWGSFSGLTDGALRLGTVDMDVAVVGRQCSGRASFTIHNLTPVSVPMGVETHAENGLYLHAQLSWGGMAPGGSIECTVEWTYSYYGGGLPDRLSGSTLCLYSKTFSKEYTIPLVLDFPSDGLQYLTVRRTGPGTVTDADGRVLEGEVTIPIRGTELRITPDSGCYVKSVTLNSRELGSVTSCTIPPADHNAHELVCVFDTLEHREFPVPGTDGAWAANRPAIGTETFTDTPDGSVRTVTLYPADTGFLCHEPGEMFDVVNLELQDAQTRQQIFQPEEWLIYTTGMYGTNGTLRKSPDGLLWYFPADVQVGIHHACVRVVSSAKAPKNEPSAWARADVDAAVAAGIVPEQLRSAYDQPATRAEFCALATRLYETALGPITGYDAAVFEDTTDVNVLKMASLQVVNGVGGNRFAPDQSLTREQAATMLARLARAMGKPLPSGSTGYADQTDISGWAADAVGAMQTGGIMGGVGNNRFAPKGSYTREQSIITALRLFRKLG